MVKEKSSKFLPSGGVKSTVEDEIYKISKEGRWEDGEEFGRKHTILGRVDWFLLLKIVLSKSFGEKSFNRLGEIRQVRVTFPL